MASAAIKTEGLRSAVLCEQGDGERLRELEFAHDSVSAVSLAMAAGVKADAELAKAHGISVIDDLYIRDGGVGHVRVEGAGSVVAATRSEDRGMAASRAKVEGPSPRLRASVPQASAFVIAKSNGT